MAIPVHDSVPVRRTPWLTYLLIAANVMIFLITPAAGSAGVETVNLHRLCELEAFYDRYAAIPEEVLDNRQLPDSATGSRSHSGNGHLPNRTSAAKSGAPRPAAVDSCRVELHEWNHRTRGGMRHARRSSVGIW
jgi:hypothetical protein